MQNTPDIHIARRPQNDGPTAFELTLSGSGKLQTLAQELEARLQSYTTHITTHKRGTNLQLAFVADKAPLDKWELGRINREALLALHGNEFKE